MTDLAPNDWDALQALAGRAGLPAERVGLLRRRCAASEDRPGSPYVLLASRPDAGLELLLARWLAPEVAERLLQVGERPLVIGPEPAQVRPKLGVWPFQEWQGWRTGHLLALRCVTTPPADVLAQLGSLGHLDQMVLVTRLGQPLHQQERALAKALAALAATVRVLVIAVPGEEPTPKDLAEVTAYAVSQMRQANFDGRCLGAGVWFTSGDHRPGTIADVARFLLVKPEEVAAGRRGMVRQAMTELLSEVHRAAGSMPTLPQASVADAECDRLTREFGNFLADLGRELDRQVEKRHPWTTEALRNYALDAVRGWGSYAGIEGAWLKYLERLRPGTQEGLLQEAQAAFVLLDYQPGSAPTREPSGFANAHWLVTEAKRLAIALSLGIGVYLVVTALLGNNQPAIALPGLLVTLLSYVAFIIGTILGYGAGSRLFRAKPRGPKPEPKVPRQPAVQGWTQVERRLMAWIGERLRARQPTPLEECQDLARRLRLEGIDV